MIDTHIVHREKEMSCFENQVKLKEEMGDVRVPLIAATTKGKT